jgi:hypothetical protein
MEALAAGILRVMSGEEKPIALARNSDGKE